MKRRYGLPFKGFVSGQRRYTVDPGKVTENSHDYVLIPSEGKFVKRRGTMRAGWCFTGNGVITSRFEAGVTINDIYARQVIELKSDAISDGYPTHLVLYENDGTAGMVLWDSAEPFPVNNCSMVANSNIMTTATANGFEDVTLGTRVQITGIPTTVVAQVIQIDSTTQIRLNWETATAIVSQQATIGGVDHGLNRRIGSSWGSNHYPGRKHIVPVPGKTNRLKAASERALTALGSRRVVTVADWMYFGNCNLGHMPMKWGMDWQDRLNSGSRKERYYPAMNLPPLWMNVTQGTSQASGAFGFKSGKTYFFSCMFKYRDGSWSRPFVPQDKPAQGTNFFGRLDITQDCDSLTITIPIGPKDVVARAILRTAAGSPPALVDVAGNSLLGFCAIVDNNYETSYTLTDANDGGLAFDPVLVRFDHTMMPPTRYLWSGDQRMWGGYLKPSIGSILICPKDNVDEDSPSADYQFDYVNTIGLPGTFVLTLRKGANTTAIALTGTTSTVQDLLDAINSTTDTGANGGAWAAVLVPGADQGLSLQHMLDTTTIDYGDAAAGRQKATSNALPGLITIDPASTPIANLETRKRTIWFTMGGPGLTGHSPNLSIKNFRDAPARWGYFVGGASLLDGQIVCFSKAIGIVRNIRGGKSGLDDDYRLESFNENRGCISDASIVQGDGWVGYMTVDGYVVTDGTREVVISYDLYHPADNYGAFKGTIKNCIAAEATNDGEAAARYISASLIESRLHLCFDATGASTDFRPGNTNVGSSYGDIVMIYDFSQGAPGSGLQEVLDSEGKPFGWSAPLTVGPNWTSGPVGGVCGLVRRLNNDSTKPRVIYANGYLEATLARPGGAINRLHEPVGYDQTKTARGNSTSVFTADAVLDGVVTAGTLSHVTPMALGGLWLSTSGTNIRRGSTIASEPTTTLVSLTHGGSVSEVEVSVGADTGFVVGAEIPSILFGASDFCESLGYKRMRNATVLYRTTNASAKGKIGGTNRRDRATSFSVTLPVSASAGGVGTAELFARKRIDIPTSNSNNGELVEFYLGELSDSVDPSGGDPIEFWGLEAEVDEVTTYR